VDLNNREIALLFWLAVVLVGMLSRRDFRAALGELSRIVVQPVISIPLVLFAAYVLGLVVVASQINLWEPALTNDAVLWFFVVGLALLFNIKRVFGQDDFFLRTARLALGATIFVEFFVGLAILPLPVELALLPLITLLVMMSAFATGKPEYGLVRRLVDGILSWIGVAIFGFVALSLVVNHELFDVERGLRAFALPVWLTLGSLPFVYALGLYAAYDSAFNQIDFWARNGGAPREVKLALLSTLHFRARKVGSFEGRWLRQVAESRSYREARQVVLRFLRDQPPDRATTTAGPTRSPKV
jgi:hypothetical protein